MHLLLYYIHEPPLWFLFVTCLTDLYSTPFLQYIHYPSSAYFQTISVSKLLNLNCPFDVLLFFFLSWHFLITPSENLCTKVPLTFISTNSTLPALSSALSVVLDGWHQVFKRMYLHYLYSLQLWLHPFNSRSQTYSALVLLTFIPHLSRLASISQLSIQITMSSANISLLKLLPDLTCQPVYQHWEEKGAQNRSPM